MKKRKIIIVVQDENPDCKIIEQKLGQYLESLKINDEKNFQVSLHMPECNLMQFMQKEKEFTKSILGQRLLFKFNQRMLENNKQDKKVILEKTDRAGNKDLLEQEYDDIFIIDTSQQ